MDDMRAMSLLQGLAMHSVEEADLGSVLSRICELAIALSDADFGDVQLIDAKTSDLQIVAQRGLPPGWTDARNAAEEPGVCETAVASRARVIVEDVRASPLFEGKPSLKVQLDAGIRAVQSTPLLTRTGKTVGVVSTHYRQPHRPDERVQRWLDLLARQAADLIENAHVSAALQQSEARFRALAMATFDVVYRMSPDWSHMRYLEGKGFLSDTAEASEGWLAAYIDPADRALVTGAIEKAIRTRTPFDLVHRVRRTDGTLGWTHSRAVPLLDAQGNIAEWFGAASDVTQARQTASELFDEQQRLQALLEALPVGVAFTNSPTCDHVSGNKILLEQFDAGRADNVSATALSAEEYGRRIVYLHEGRPLSADELPLQRAAREGQTIAPMELRVQLPTGKEFFTEVSGSPIRNAHGHVVGAVAVSTDATERKRAERAREQVRLKDEFLAVLGHELRNPLTAISSAVELLKDGATAPQRDATDEIIRDQVSVLRRLVDDLLDISRITLGRMRLQREGVSLLELLSTAAAAVRPAVAARSQDLRVALPVVDIRFSADKVRLLQVLANLLDNASKYSLPGGRIELSGGLEGPDVVLRCKDSGRGVAPEAQEAIFEPLVRLASALEDAPAGLGLGLSLVKHLAELHGGSVSVDSDGLGAGSEFVVRIPFAEAASPALPAGQLAGSVEDRPLSVALVEDNSDVAQILSLVIKRLGHRVTPYADGKSALAGIPELTPDVVLLDSGLPGMTGLEVLRRLRQQPALRDTVFIGMSGLPRPDETAKHGARFDHFLAKPIDLKDIAALLVRRADSAKRLRTLLVEARPELPTSMGALLRSEGLDLVCASTGQAALDLAMDKRPQILLCDMRLPDMDGLDVIDRLRHQLASWGTYVAMVAAGSEPELRPYQGMARELGVDEFVSRPITAGWARDLVARLGNQGAARPSQPT